MHVCVYACMTIYWMLVNVVSYKSLVGNWAFHQSYDLGAVNDDNDFKVNRSRVSVTVRPQMVKSALRELFLSCVQTAWMYFDETYHIYSLPGPHKLMTFSGSWVQSSRSQTTFSENAFSSRGIPVDCSHRRRPSSYAETTAQRMHNMNSNIELVLHYVLSVTCCFHELSWLSDSEL